MKGAVLSLLRAALIPLAMSFSYGLGSNPPIDYPRLLVSDTQQFQADGVTRAYVFEDQEITSFTNIVAGVYQSSMQYTPPGGLSHLPSSPVSYIRIAAYMLNSLAASKGRLAGITQILDVKLSMKDAAAALQAQAKAWLDLDDNSGAFAIIEQVHDEWSFKDRWWKQAQRLSFGV